MIVRELGPSETHRAARTLLQLRGHHASAEALVERIERLRPGGYRLAGAFEDGAEDAAAVAGFRINEMLAWGHHLYVDDLVTAEGHRGRGLADALFEWLQDEARRHGCTAFHLDSGVGEDRQDAHRFYFRHGLRIGAYHFQREL